MNIKPEQIIIGAGTEYLYSLIIQLLGNDVKYGLETLVIQKLHKFIKV